MLLYSIVLVPVNHPDEVVVFAYQNWYQAWQKFVSLLYQYGFHNSFYRYQNNDNFTEIYNKKYHGLENDDYIIEFKTHYQTL